MSWPISLGAVVLLTRSEWDLTLWTRTRRVPIASIASPGTWVYLEHRGRILRQELGTSRFEDLGLSTSEHHSLVREPQGWNLEFYTFPTQDQVRIHGRILAPASWLGPEYWDSRFDGIQRNPWNKKALGGAVLRGAYFFDEGSALNAVIQVGMDGMGAVTVRNGAGSLEHLRIFTPFHRADYGASVTLPNGTVLFQMDGWVMALSPAVLERAPVGPGRLRMVLLEPKGAPAPG